MRIPQRLVVAACLLVASARAALGAVSLADCLASVDPYPGGGSSVALSESSLFFATSGALPNTIELRFAGGSLTAGDYASIATVVTNSRTACFTAPGTGELSSISWAKSLDAAGTVVAIGSPARTSAGALFTYSAIDLLFIAPSSSQPTPSNLTSPSRDIGPGGWLTQAPRTLAAQATVQSTSLIDDTAAPMLGQAIALDRNGRLLASLFDASTVAIYSVVRGVSSFNTSYDVKLALPSNFVPDSLALRSGVLAVIGSLVDTTSGRCNVGVQLYLQDATDSTGLTWLLGDWTLLTRSGTQPASVTALANLVVCPSGPSGLFPVRLSDDGTLLLASVRSWNTAFYGSTSNLLDSTVRMNGSAVSTSASTLFGRSVAFGFDPTAASSSFAYAPRLHVASQQRIYTFSGADFALYSPRMKTNAPGCGAGIGRSLSTLSTCKGYGNSSTILTASLPESIASAVFPNRQQHRQLNAARTIDTLASHSGFTVAALSPSPSLLDVSKRLLVNPSAPVGTQYHAELEVFTKCPRGFYQDGGGSNPSSSKWRAPSSWPIPVRSTSYANGWTAGADQFWATGGAQQPCAFCPTGSFTDDTGSFVCKPCGGGRGLTFCPPSSVYNWTDSVLGMAQYQSSLPALVAEPVKQRFEETVLRQLFSTSHNTLVAFIILIVITAFLLILWVLPHPLCERYFRPLAVAILNIFTFINLPNVLMGHGDDDKKAASASASAAPSAPMTRAPSKRQVLSPSNGSTMSPVPAATPPPPMDDETATSCRCIKEATLDSQRFLAGFWASVFLVFFIGLLTFSIEFLSDFDARQPCGQGKNNCQAIETIESIDAVQLSTYPDQVAAYHALSAAPGWLLLDIVGLTGLRDDGGELCSNSTLLSLTVDGCIIDWTGGRCDLDAYRRVDVMETSPTYAATVRSLPLPPFGVCRLAWAIPRGASFDAIITTTFEIAPFATWASLRFWYLQDSFVYGGSDGLVTGSRYQLGRSNFVSNRQGMTDGGAGSQAIESYPQAHTEIQLTYGVLGRETQLSSDVPVSWSGTWFNTVSHTQRNASLTSYRSWITDTAPSTKIQITQFTNQVTWRHQLVSKLVEPSYGFLVVLMISICLLYLARILFHLSIFIWNFASWAHNFVQESRRIAANSTAGRERARARLRKRGLENRFVMPGLSVIMRYNAGEDEEDDNETDAPDNSQPQPQPQPQQELMPLGRESPAFDLALVRTNGEEPPIRLTSASPPMAPNREASPRPPAFSPYSPSPLPPSHPPTRHVLRVHHVPSRSQPHIVLTPLNRTRVDPVQSVPPQSLPGDDLLDALPIAPSLYLSPPPLDPTPAAAHVRLPSSSLLAPPSPCSLASSDSGDSTFAFDASAAPTPTPASPQQLQVDLEHPPHLTVDVGLPTVSASSPESPATHFIVTSPVEDANAEIQLADVNAQPPSDQEANTSARAAVTPSSKRAYRPYVRS